MSRSSNPQKIDTLQAWIQTTKVYKEKAKEILAQKMKRPQKGNWYKKK